MRGVINPEEWAKVPGRWHGEFEGARFGSCFDPISTSFADRLAKRLVSKGWKADAPASDATVLFSPGRRTVASSAA